MKRNIRIHLMTAVILMLCCIVIQAGAYGYSMANNYNRNPIPGVILVEKGKAEWMVKPQTYEQMICCDVIPESLK